MKVFNVVQYGIRIPAKMDDYSPFFIWIMPPLVFYD